MNLTCAVLIAGFCLPAQSMSVRVDSGLLGAKAKAEIGAGVIELDLWSDEVSTNFSDLQEYCRGKACIRYNTSLSASPNGSLRRFEFGFPQEGARRTLRISAPTLADADQLADTIGLALGSGSELDLIPLSELVRASTTPAR